MWLSADPKAHLFPSHSPYNYCLNNPINLVDPNGEIALPLYAVMIIGAVIQGGSYVANVAMGNTTWNTGQFFLNLGVGAVSGAISSGIGTAFGPVGSVMNEICRAATHGVAGIITNGIMGNQPTVSGFVASCFSSLVGSATAGLHPLAQIGISGLAGGVAALMTGGDFLQGMASGLIVSALNHTAHGIANTIEADKYVQSVRAFLEDLGYSADQVAKDVVKHPSAFWGQKYAKMNNFDSYKGSFTSGQYDSYSGKKNAWISSTREINVMGDKQSYALKYYPSRDFSIGIVRTGWGHYYEAGLEKIDGFIRNRTGRDNFIYDMHGRNATLYLLFRK